MSTPPARDSEANPLGDGSVAGTIDSPQLGLKRPRSEPPRPDLGAEPPPIRARRAELDEVSDRPVATLGLALDREFDLCRLRQPVAEDALARDRPGRERRSGDRAMARLGPTIAERPPRLGDELPVIARRVKCELEDSERVVLCHLAVWSQGVQA